MSRAALLLVLAAASAGAPARAADQLAVVSVADPPAGASAALAELTHQLRAALRERTAGVLEAPDLRARLLGPNAAAALPELERAYARAQAAFDADDAGAAARALEAIASEAERLAAPQAHELRVRALVRLGFVERHRGRAASAAQVLERLAALEPGFAVDDREYPPSYRKEAAEVRRRIAARPRARLTVTAGGEALAAFVDGKPIGPTPATIALPRGSYRVGVAVGEVPVPTVGVELDASDRAVDVDVTVAEALRLDAGPGLALPAPARLPGLARAGAWLGASRLVAASEAAEGEARFLDGALYDVARGALVRQGRVRLTAGAAAPAQLGALAAFLLTGQPARGVTPVDLATAAADAAERTTLARAPVANLAAPVGPPVAPAVAAQERRGWVKPAAYGAGVVALGLAGVAGWQGIAARDRSSEADAMLRSDGVFAPGFTQQAYDDRRAAADAARRTAYVAAGGALVFAATAGVLGYLSWTDDGAPAVRF